MFGTHLHSLSATLLSGVGGGGVVVRETEEREEGTTLLLRVLLCKCMRPCPFLLVTCKCRASASLRVLAKKRYNGGGDHGNRGPHPSAAAARGAVGGCTCSSQGRFGGRGLHLQPIRVLARWGPNHQLVMDPPAGDQAGHAREHDWAALARELRFWLNRREDQLEEGLVDLGQQLLGRLVARARAARLRALEAEPVPVKAPPAVLPHNTAARSPSPKTRVWYGGSANKLALCSRRRRPR